MGKFIKILTSILALVFLIVGAVFVGTGIHIKDGKVSWYLTEDTAITPPKSYSDHKSSEESSANRTENSNKSGTHNIDGDSQQAPSNNGYTSKFFIGQQGYNLAAANSNQEEELNSDLDQLEADFNDFTGTVSAEATDLSDYDLSAEDGTQLMFPNDKDVTSMADGKLSPIGMIYKAIDFRDDDKDAEAIYVLTYSGDVYRLDVGVTDTFSKVTDSDDFIYDGYTHYLNDVANSSSSDDSSDLDENGDEFSI